ncbi:MAG: hypothetical protein QXW97_04705 [Candidatus Pacearchaeota archaeon]
MSDILYSTGELDVLQYYSKFFKVLKNFLYRKKIASKVHLSNLFFLKRGSNSPALYIDDFSEVDSKMLKLRTGNHLKDVESKLTPKQRLIWEYFPPRKLSQLFYATNDEGIGKPIERIFIDIDRKKNSADDARKVALFLLRCIQDDREFNNLVDVKKIVILWTGASFHIYILLKKEIELKFYNKYLSYGSEKKREFSFIMKWAKIISDKTDIPVLGGHEKTEKNIVLDSSNTPSGKLARSPFSLHIKDWQNWDGVCVPVSAESLSNKNLVSELEKLTPDLVLKNLDFYKSLL